MRRAYSHSPLALSQDTKELLHFWLHILHHLKVSSMPIPHLYGVPPLDIAAFVKGNFRSMVYFSFFDFLTKIHTFTNFYACMSKNDFKIVKIIF